MRGTPADNLKTIKQGFPFSEKPCFVMFLRNRIFSLQPAHLTIYSRYIIIKIEIFENLCVGICKNASNSIRILHTPFFVIFALNTITLINSDTVLDGFLA